MLSRRMLGELNDQINREFDSAYKYLSAAAWSEANNLPGFANWMRLQWQEEIEHAMKIFDYVNEQREHVKLQEVGKPIVDFKSPLELAQIVLQYEQDQSAAIYRLVDIAVEEDDKATQVFLQWFVEEQVEEEKQSNYLVDTLKMIGDSSIALLMFDRELGERKK